MNIFNLFLVKKKELLTTFWLVCVCFFLLQIYLSYLHTRLTFEKTFYPKTFSELYERRDDYANHTTDLGHDVFTLSRNEAVQKFAKVVKRIYIKDLIEIIGTIGKMKTVTFAKGEWIAALNLFNPKRFVQIDEELFRGQPCFLVNKKFKYAKKFIKM